MIVSEYPEFSWSFSRHKTMMECEFKYFCSYYSSHNGWLKDSHAISKHIYRLKKMTNLEMLLGEKVHEYIEKIIANGFNKNLINEAVMQKTIWNDIEKTMESSYRDYYKWYEKPSSTQMLHEIYYENEIPTDKIEDIKERIRIIVTNLFNNETFKRLRRKEIIINQDTEKFRYMNNDGMKIWVKLDLHYSDPLTGKRTVVDWKTGNSNIADRYQLALYSHYISRIYKMSNFDNIEIRNEYLLHNESKIYNLQKIDIDNMRELVKLSINRMEEYLIDIENNKPLDESYFQQTDNQNICNRCNFKEICLR